MTEIGRRRFFRSAAVLVALLVVLTGCEPGSSVARHSSVAREPSSGGASPSAAHPFPDEAGINAYLAELARQGRLSGTVLLARGGDRFAHAYGLADRANTVPNTVDTMYRLGSVTKQFTAMAVLILQQQRRLNVTDRVCGYLDRCPPPWAAITLDQLLTHRSGIPDYLNELGLGWPPHSVDPAELVDEFRDAPLILAPGSRMRYSNSGYALLGYVIERITGHTYAEFIQREILDPLAMTHTGFDTTAIRVGHAVGYYANGRVPDPYPMSALYSAGALYSTAIDLARWDDALDHDTLVPASTMEQMLTEHVACPPPGNAGGCLLPTDIGYGYGWFITHASRGTLDYHVGRIDGYVSFNGLYRAGQLHIIVLSNSEATDVLNIARALAARVQGR